jgi:hypothetical protein
MILSVVGSKYKMGLFVRDENCLVLYVSISFNKHTIYYSDAVLSRLL